MEMPGARTRRMGLLVPRSTFSATLPKAPPVSGHGYEIDVVHLCVVGDLQGGVLSVPYGGAGVYLFLLEALLGPIERFSSRAPLRLGCGGEDPEEDHLRFVG